MPIEHAHSFLLSPGKNLETQPDIVGATIPLAGKLYKMLQDTYDKAEYECNVEISFNPNDQRQQQNDCRDLVVAYINSPTEKIGRSLAERLQKVTTNRSGMGLLFFMLGKSGSKYQLVISRFPAESGILADQKNGSLTVAFLERIFMKSATSYKSVVYVGSSMSSDFWHGNAVDKQINDSHIVVSDYWIKDFLMSDFKTTPAAGTRRLAGLLKRVARATKSLDVKEQISSAARLSKGLAGKSISISDFADLLHLSPEVKNEMRDNLKSEAMFDEKFRFDLEEFQIYIHYKSIELDNGAILTAEAAEFDKIFKQEKKGSKTRYSTEGNVVGSLLKKAK